MYTRSRGKSIQGHCMLTKLLFALVWILQTINLCSSQWNFHWWKQLNRQKREGFADFAHFLLFAAALYAMWCVCPRVFRENAFLNITGSCWKKRKVGEVQGQTGKLKLPRSKPSWTALAMLWASTAAGAAQLWPIQQLCLLLDTAVLQGSNQLRK